MDHTDSWKAAFDTYGDEVDDAVMLAGARGLAKQFLKEPDPYASLMEWYRGIVPSLSGAGVLKH